MADPTDLLRRDLRAVETATGDALLREIRHAVAGREGYRSRWPVGPSRDGRRHSRDTMLVTGRRGSIRIRNPQRHAVLIELRPELRRRRNRHHQALLRSLRVSWQRIGRRASATASQAR